MKILPLEVIVNQARLGQVILLDRGGALYATLETLQEWRIDPPAGQKPVNYRAQQWYPLFALPGYRARFDVTTQTVDLEFSSEAFAATRVKGKSAERPAISPKAPALFVNYDLSNTFSATSGASVSRDTGALAEVGLSYGSGVLTSGYVGQNLGSSDPALPMKWRRLETTWTRDFPDTNSTLRVGDGSTRAGMWGRAVYFGGIQFGRNFALTPGFLSQPIPTIAGSALGPSTVELFINDALRQSTSVPSGPFTLENLPLISGSGEARIVVRDVLGRETVITRSFFTSSSLLEKDLSDWSVEAGLLRRNLGINNADYKDPFASGLYRHGVTQGLTAEGRVEASAAVQSGGIGITAALPFEMLAQAAVAVSNADVAGRGGKLYATLDRSSLRSGFSVSASRATVGYRQLGFGDTELPYKRELSANYRHSFGEHAAAGITAARLDTYDNGTVGALSASYSMRIGERASLVFSASRLSGTAPGSALSVSLLMPLASRRTITSNVTHKAGITEGYLGASDPVDSQTGFGWRALTGSRGQQEFAEGGLYYQGSTAFASADISSSRETQTVRVGLQGALVAMDGRVFATRRLQDSFAVVEVPGYANVGVGVQGSILARTNAEGIALLPRLLPYQVNGIRLDPNDLPFSAELDSIEVTAVPAWRSGVKVTFPVRSGRGALVRIVLDNGDPAPAGAEVELVGDKKEFFVARRGEAFITGLQDRSTLRLKWKGRSCDIPVALPPSAPEEIVRVGPYTCQGVRP